MNLIYRCWPIPTGKSRSCEGAHSTALDHLPCEMLTRTLAEDLDCLPSGIDNVDVRLNGCSWTEVTAVMCCSVILDSLPIELCWHTTIIMTYHVDALE